MSPDTPLELLLGELHDEPRRAAVRSLSLNDDALQGWLEESRAACPGVVLSPQHFCRAVAAHLATTPLESTGRWLEQLQPADLYLAQACRQGDDTAIALLEQRFGGKLRAIARRFQGPTASVDDLLQILRFKLLVGEEERPPKIAFYSGQGPLGSWLSVTAVRTCLDVTRTGAQHKREDPTEEQTLETLIDAADDFELAFLKERYRAEFKSAVADALRSLTSADRNLLRHHWLSGLTIDQIGAVYGIHRATAARRVARARTALYEATRLQLGRRLRVGHDELDSIMNLIVSRLDVSVYRLLDTPSQPPVGSNSGE